MAPGANGTLVPTGLPGLAHWIKHRWQQDEERLEWSPEYAPGFAEVSAFISSDTEGGLYRRFRELSARNILYMQSELASLEADLLAMDREDLANTDTAQRMMNERAAKDWDTLSTLSGSNGPQPANVRQKRRMGYIMSMRRLVKAYQKAVCLDQQVAVLPSPTSAYLKSFRAFVKMKKGAISLRGPQLDEIEQSEYVVTYKAPEVDRLTTLIEAAIMDSGISLFEVSI
ncbi:hypothetical protein LTR65_006266 [Meristemomyces frigidus]